MKRIAVYGTLKKGFYNHYDDEMGDMVGTATVSGVMQSNGMYPYLFEDIEGVENKEYEVELYEVEDTTYDRITRMELGSGYYVGTIDTDIGQSEIYWAHRDYYRPEREILSVFK